MHSLLKIPKQMWERKFSSILGIKLSNYQLPDFSCKSTSVGRFEDISESAKILEGV